ncbi:MAG: cysteine peptidase family C39 domain-containing protein, partial [Rhodoferax sp.]|nr:cysteine peptidase family C39 domain-containing protein [Rhodoferax sp.]
MAISSLCAIARFHQVACDPATLAHQLGIASTDALTTDDLLRAAQHLGLKAKLSRSSIARLGLLPLPALAVMQTQDACLRV